MPRSHRQTAERPSGAAAAPAAAPAVHALHAALARRAAAGALLASLVLSGCGGAGVSAPGAASEPASTSTPAIVPAALNPPAAPGSLIPRSSTFASGFASPWSIAWLPDGRLLVAQKGGALLQVSADGRSRSTLAWPSPGPQIRDGGQGGLLGLAVDPDFATTSPHVYIAYQEPGTNGLSGTAVARLRLQGSTLSGFERLLQQQPKVAQDGVHFGSRLAFLPDRTLLVSLGDRGQDSPSAPDSRFAQNPAMSLGKLMRVARDGSTPAGNPAFGAGALPQLWSLGHRNPQGLAVDRATGAVWSTEHGPQGGDELNRILPGRNYGWPLRSYGCAYGAPVGPDCRAGGGLHSPLNGLSFTEPVTAWVPTSTAPSNLIVLRGSGFPEWDGQLLIGALAGTGLWRVAVDEHTGAVSRSQLLQSLGRVRDLAQGPDGWVYLATDDGRIVRLDR